MTQACALACRHCRAEAISTPNPQELTFEQGVEFLRHIPEFGDPMPQLILTGGDPLARADLYELIDEARRLGIGVSITPAATPALTREVLVKLQQHGVEGLGLSRIFNRPRPVTIRSAAYPARFFAPPRRSDGRRNWGCLCR